MSPMPMVWETELANFLRTLSAVQSRTLDVLARKRQMLAHADAAGLSAINAEEEDLIDSLQDCLDRREELLSQARQEGLPSDSLRSLAQAIPSEGKGDLLKQFQEAKSRSRLLQHQSLTNWLLVQKTLIHLSQLLEIIATGGRMKPTYGKEELACARGSLLNQDV